MFKKIAPATLLLCLFCNAVSHGQTFVRNLKLAESFTKFNNLIYFAGGDDAQGYGLWKTDGTAAGTVLVKKTTVNGQYPIFNIVAYKNKLYFTGNDAVNGPELWVSDGTTAGTAMFKDINPVRTGNTGSQPGQFTICNDILFFTASSLGLNNSLWRTDGTAAGTVELTSTDYLGTGQLTAVGNVLYFTVSGNRQLWRSDGTKAGTKQVNVDDNYTVDLLTKVNDQLVLITNTSYRQNIKLYKLDPSTDAPTLLQTFNAATYGSNDIDNITAVGNNFYFSIRATDGNSKSIDALWVSNGTAVGTKMLKSYNWTSYMAYSHMHDFVAFNNKLYFAATSSHALTTSDGSEAGTTQFSTGKVKFGSKPVISNNKLFFAELAGGIGSVDGTSVKQEVTAPNDPQRFFDHNGVLYFLGNKSAELWNNVPTGQMQVTANYANLLNGGAINFTSKVDSILSYSITIKNTGNKDLVLGDIGVIGTPFYVNGQPSKTILAGKQTTFNLIYDPTKEELTSGALQIKNNDSANGLFSAVISGTATGKAKKRSDLPANGMFKSIVFNDSIPSFTITNNTIAENAAANTVIGSFQLNAATGYQYTLVSGTGDENNAAFSIENGALKALSSFDHEVKNTYTIRVKASNGTLSYEKSFAIVVSDVQEDLVAQGCDLRPQNLTYTLDDVAYAGSRIIAVGNLGKILISDNDGIDWSPVSIGAGNWLTTVKMVTDRIGYTIGSAVLKTEDGGNNWFPLEIPDIAYPYPNSMAFPSAQTGYLFGEYKLLKTTDGGKNWKKLNFNGSYINSGWFIDDNNGFVCGNSQLLMRTVDGGVTWTNVSTVSLGFNVAFSQITFVNASTGFIAASNGTILQTKDGGATWTKVGAVSVESVSRLVFLDVNTGYMVAGYNNSAIYKTIDGGVTWTNELRTGSALIGFAYNAAKNKFCVVGHGIGLGYSARQGHTIYLKNGSANWTLRSVLGGGNYYTQNIVDDKTIYVFGTDNGKTTDGGITWKRMNVIADLNGVRTSYFTSKDVGYYSNLSNVYKTMDGGETWAALNVPGYSNALHMKFINDNVGFVSTGGGIFKTGDAGATWTNVLPQVSLGGVKSISFVDQQNGFAVGLGSNFHKTTDQGTTWTTTTIPGSPFLMVCHFFDEQTGLVGGTTGTILRTTDGGNTWNTVAVPSTNLVFYGFTFFDKLHGLATANNFNSAMSQVFETFDGGLTWNLFLQESYGLFQTELMNGSIIIVGDGGYVTKYSNELYKASNVGYIKGETEVVNGVKTSYSVPSAPETYYRWTVQGDASVSYQNNTVNVTWKKGGTYTVKATSYNKCGEGDSRTLTVNVLDIPEPVITGPDSVLAKSADINYNTPLHAGNTYNWSVAGGTHVASNDKTSVTWGSAGAGTVTVIETNTTLNIKRSAIKNVVISDAPFTLPVNNFTVLTNASSCKGANNGSVTIKAAQKLNYVATFTGPGTATKSYTFTDSLKIPDLVTGNYGLCISVTGNQGFQRCYTLSITEPKDLSVYSAIDKAAQMLTLNMTGADVYFIQYNGELYQTNNSQIRLPLKNGVNRVKVNTDKDCQGVFEDNIAYDMISVYPNPVGNTLNIDLGGALASSAKIEVRGLFGKALLSKSYKNVTSIQADVAELEPGIYVLKLVLGKEESTYKIIKK